MISKVENLTETISTSEKN